jgi:hypothetical protein
LGDEKRDVRYAEDRFGKANHDLRITVVELAT